MRHFICSRLKLNCLVFYQILFKAGQAKQAGQAGHAGQSGYDFSPELGEAFDSLAPKQAGASFLPFGMYLKYSLATFSNFFVYDIINKKV